MLLTPVLGAAATASCPRSRSLLTSLDPISPVPPTTTIFMIVPSFLRAHFKSARLTRYDQIAIPHFWRNSLGFAPVFSGSGGLPTCTALATRFVPWRPIQRVTSPPPVERLTVL